MTSISPPLCGEGVIVMWPLCRILGSIGAQIKTFQFKIASQILLVQWADNWADVLIMKSVESDSLPVLYVHMQFLSCHSGFHIQLGTLCTQVFLQKMKSKPSMCKSDICMVYLCNSVFVTDVHGVISLWWCLISVSSACIGGTMRNHGSLFKILNHKHHLEGRNEGTKGRKEGQGEGERVRGEEGR